MSARSELDARLQALSAAPAYQGYLKAREHVLAMLDSAHSAQSETGTPSAYWNEELSNIEYMLDASPLVIERLRHHSYNITGIWAYTYRTHADERRRLHKLKLDALLSIADPSLFVPESPALGGFGFELEEGLVNLDTLKFYEALAALDAAEVLNEFRLAEERTVVWEIGAGWGGFPFVFKTLFPNVTYVISDLPELFLFSATYLQAVFPDATFAFHPGDATTLDDEVWLGADFVFVPAHALDAITPPRLDLAINMVSFQEMSSEQVRAYAEHARACGVPFLYSLNRERSVYNPSHQGVSKILEESFWLQEVELLSVTYQRLPKEAPKPVARKIPKAATGAGPSDVSHNDYRHLIGWPRRATSTLG